MIPTEINHVEPRYYLVHALRCALNESIVSGRPNVKIAQAWNGWICQVGPIYVLFSNSDQVIEALKEFYKEVQRDKPDAHGR
jgi:hypothetical protein